MLAGNHDHGLVAGWIDARLQSEPLRLPRAERAGRAGSRPGRWRSGSPTSPRPRALRLAYPGVWLRDDVYAIHGHYLDLHSTVPTFERLAAGAMARWVVRLPEHGARPDDYEAALAPLYACLHQLTQRSDHARGQRRAPARRRAPGSRSRARGARATPCARPRSARATSARSPRSTRSGSGRSTATCPAAALRRGGLRGMREVLRRLGVDRAARAVRPHPPLRPVAARRPGGVDDAGRRAAGQHRLVGLPAALPLRRAERARPTGRAPRS